MDRYLGYAVIVFLLALAAWVVLNQSIPLEDKVKVHEDPSFYVALREANTVVLRVVYPFSDARGVLDAAFIGIEVLTYKRKAVIFQQVEANRCVRTVFVPGYVTEMNRPEVNVLSPEACYLESDYFPTVEISEGPYEVYAEGLTARLRGKYPYFSDLMKFFLRRVYPDVDQILAKAGEIVSKRRQ